MQLSKFKISSTSLGTKIDDASGIGCKERNESLVKSQFSENTQKRVFKGFNSEYLLKSFLFLDQKNVGHYNRQQCKIKLIK